VIVRFLLILVAFATFSGIESVAQTSRLVPWRDYPQRRSYEPMPVLCVHGIGSDSVETWPIGVNILSNYFSTTYYWQGASQVSRQRANQPGAAYVETFDYGVYGDPTIVTTHGHEQTFDTIRSNAWDGVYQTSVNGCITLRTRISNVRDKYTLANGTRPNITLLAHSMGGIVAHYYLCRAEEDGVDLGVARLITLGTPHYGSTIPNWQRQVNSAAGGRAALMRPLQQHSMEYFLQYCAGFYERDAWNFVHYANPPVNQPEKGGMTDMSYHVPYAGNIVPFLRNPLIPYFQTHPVAGDVEYVVNSFTVPILSIQMLKNLGISMVRLLDSNIPFLEAFGDGIVPTFSQEGRALPGSDPDIYMGMNFLQGAVIRPVIYSGWKHIHMGEAQVGQALLYTATEISAHNCAIY